MTKYSVGEENDRLGEALRSYEESERSLKVISQAIEEENKDLQREIDLLEEQRTHLRQQSTIDRTNLSQQEKEHRILNEQQQRIVNEQISDIRRRYEETQLALKKILFSEIGFQRCSEQSEESSSTSSSFNGEENLSPHVNGDSFSPEKIVVHPRRSSTEENETLPESAMETNNVDPSFEEEEEEEEEVTDVDLLPVISDVPLDEEAQRFTTELENNDEFHLPTHSEEKQEDLKTQRALDEDETIPPLDSSSEEKDVSSSSHELLLDEKDEESDVRPLTALEDPYGVGHRVELVDSSSLVDSVVEEEKSEVLIPAIELCQPSFDEVSHHSMNKDDNEVLPPLTSLSLALERVNDPEPIVIPDEEVLLPPRLFDVEDVLGNKTLLKQTLVAGAERGHPTRSTLACVSYRLSLVEIGSGLSLLIDEVREESFFVGECDILPAIDICVQLMSEGERASITSDIRHCYGEKGLEEKRIPPTNKDQPNYQMNIDLHLQRWSPAPDPQTLPANERLFWEIKSVNVEISSFVATSIRTLFSVIAGAHRFLDIELNPLLSSISAEERSTLIDRYIQVENNVAQVNLRLNHLESCLTATENVLRYDPQNGKALFRQGKALFQLGRYDLALQSLTKVQRVNCSDQESIQQMIVTSRAKIEGYHKNEKEIYRRMFQPPPPSPPTSNSTRNQIEKQSPAWWNYAALGGVAVALAGALIYLNRRSS